MGQRRRWDRFEVLGLYVSVSVVTNIVVNVIRDDTGEIFWYCNVAAVILAVALFKKSTFWITTVLSSAIPAQALWISDFFLELAGHGMGRTHFLMSEPVYDFWLSVNLHGAIIPVSLYATIQRGYHPRALKGVLIFIIPLLVLTYLLTDIYDNRNCVFYPCDGEMPGGGYLEYFIFRSLLFWVVIESLSYYCLRFLFRKKLSAP